MDLFNIERVGMAERPRIATNDERNRYLDWLAMQYGVNFNSYSGIIYGPDGITALEGKERVMIVAMPGYGDQPLPTCEILDDDGNVTRRMILPVDKRGKLPMDAKQVQGWTGLAPVRKARATKAKPSFDIAAAMANDGANASEPVECPPASPATIEAEALESPCAPAGAEMAAISAPVAIPAPAAVKAAPVPVAPPASADLSATVSALLDRVAALESDAVQRRAMVAAIAGAPARDNAARLRGARAYLELRAHRTVCRNLQRQLDAGQAQYDAIKAERDALAAERELLCQERDATIMRATHAERTLHNMGERLQGATRRADRMARAAVTQRKVASRATGDLAAARAESRALTRRLDDARALRAVADARPLPPPPTDTAMAHAFAAAA